jgi:hypothetical protein
MESLIDRAWRPLGKWEDFEMSAGGAATPLENWSRFDRTASPNPRTTLEATPAKREAVAPAAHDPLAAAHIAVFGSPLDERARAYWQSMNVETLPFTAIVDLFLSRRKIDSSDAWTKFGVICATQMNPAHWPELGPLPFIVAVHDRLAGKLPQVDQVACLLESMLDAPSTPHSVIEGLAIELNIDRSSVKALKEACKLDANRPFWRSALPHQTTFSKREIYSALVDVKTIQTLWLTQWGLQCYEAAYRLSAR